MKNNVQTFVLAAILVLFFSCSKEEIYTKVPLTFVKPSNFPDIAYNLDANPLTDKGFELGKELFYDGKLSSDGAVSCAFCHQQKFAFTHHGHALSHGVDDLEGTRNAQPIQNMAFQTQFAWDGAAFHLDLFPLIPITNPVEMGESMTSILEKLNQDETYKELYSAAFDDGEINAGNTLKALSQFMLLMVSANSKYDKYVRNEDNVIFTEQEEKGFVAFKQKCAQCHTTDLFTDDAFRNNGLPVNTELNDLGRMRVTLQEEDKYKFKVPSLRNIAVTAPYMHDGRFGSLESVLNFYTNGVQDYENLDSILRKEDNTLGILLTEEEKENIILFLNTLTDEEFLSDDRFAE